MAQISADDLRELIIFIIIENAQVRAAVSPVWHGAFLDVDNLGIEFDTALDEINQVRHGQKKQPLEVAADFRLAVIDSLLRRMEAAGRVVYQA